MATLINRDEKSLMPLLVECWKSAQAEAHKNNLMFYIFEGYRSPQRQDELFSLGRTKPGKPVTNSKGWQSWHQFGLAVDLITDADLIRPGIQFSWQGDYKAVAAIMQRHGFQWSGKWNILTKKLSGEVGHFQMTGGLKLSEAKVLFDRGGLQAVWDEVTKRVRK